MLGLAPLSRSNNWVSWDQILGNLSKTDPQKAALLRKNLTDQGLNLKREAVIRREGRFGPQQASAQQLLNRQELCDQAKINAKPTGHQHSLAKIVNLLNKFPVLTETEFETVSIMCRTYTETPEGMSRLLSQKAHSNQELVKYLSNYFRANYAPHSPGCKLLPMFNILAKMLNQLFPENCARCFALMQQVLEDIFPRRNFSYQRGETLLQLGIVSLLGHHKDKQWLVGIIREKMAKDDNYAWGQFLGTLAKIECENDLVRAVAYISGLIILSPEQLSPVAAGQTALAASLAFADNRSDQFAVFETIGAQVFIDPQQREEFLGVPDLTIAWIEEQNQNNGSMYVRQGQLTKDVSQRGAGGKKVSLRSILVAADKLKPKTPLPIPKELLEQPVIVRDQKLTHKTANEILLRTSIRIFLGLPAIDQSEKETRLSDLHVTTSQCLADILQQCRQEGLGANIRGQKQVEEALKKQEYSAKAKALCLSSYLLYSAGNMVLSPKLAGATLGKILNEFLPGRIKEQGAITGEAAKLIFNSNLEFIVAACSALQLNSFGENALFFWLVERALMLTEGCLVGQAMKIYIGRTPNPSLRQMIIEDLLTALKLDPAQAKNVMENFYRQISL